MGVFEMPSLGADMEAGTLVEWLIGPGDTVNRGDVVAVVETQKGAIEIETFEAGIVQELLAELGRELPVGSPLAVILAEGEAPPDSAAPKPAPAAAPPTPEPATAAEPAKEPIAPASVPAEEMPSGTVAISPAARLRARELGLDLSSVTGSFPGGAIVLKDVDAASGAAAPAPPKRKTNPMEEMRKAIAAAMTRSKRTIPHLYLSETIDVEPAIRFLEARNADAAPTERILLGAVFIRAATLAAAEVKEMNGRYLEDQRFVPATQVNPGVAIALRGGGLVAPALIDAVPMSLEETMAGMRDLVFRARAGRLRSSETTQGTITISSLGETGAEAMTGVIFPPQVALVGIGSPNKRPWVVDGQVVPRTVVTLTISADHRVSDGRQVARFIAVFEKLMKTPEEL